MGGRRDPSMDSPTREAVASTNKWYQKQKKKWMKDGRIREDGSLRLPQDPAKPVTAHRIAKSFNLTSKEALKICRFLSGR